MRYDAYIIEARDTNGKLNLQCEQPTNFFGAWAIQGIFADEIAQIIFRKIPNAILDGQNIHLWPSIINPLWKARRKTW